MTARIFLFACLLLWPVDALAPPSFCYDRAVLLHHLKEKFGERPRHAGLAANGFILEILVSPGGETFSAILSDAERVCIVASGESWIDIAPKEKGDPL